MNWVRKATASHRGPQVKLREGVAGVGLVADGFPAQVRLARHRYPRPPDTSELAGIPPPAAGLGRSTPLWPGIGERSRIAGRDTLVGSTSHRGRRLELSGATTMMALELKLGSQECPSPTSQRPLFGRVGLLDWPA